MGRIEAADTPNFNHADSILGFPEWNLLAGEELIQDTIPHRYWRLLSSTSHPTDFAEIYFYERGTGKRLTGKIIHPNAPIRDSVRDTPKFICDNNPLTYFTVENTDRPRWVGFDFGQPVSMEKVAYIRRGDGNDICPGDVYELYYWKIIAGIYIIDRKLIMYISISIWCQREVYIISGIALEAHRTELSFLKMEKSYGTENKTNGYQKREPLQNGKTTVPTCLQHKHC